jgi:hypothetical protein
MENGDNWFVIIRIQCFCQAFSTQLQRFYEMGVGNKKERERNEEKAGMGGVLEGTNGSHEL